MENLHEFLNKMLNNAIKLKNEGNTTIIIDDVEMNIDEYIKLLKRELEYEC